MIAGMAKNLPVDSYKVNRRKALDCIAKYQRTIESYWNKLNHTPFGTKNWRARHELLAKYTDERNGAVRMAYEMDLITEEEFEVFRLNKIGK